MTNLLSIAESEGIQVFIRQLPKGLKGLYYDGTIVLNRNIETNNERRCILAEELGHYFTTVGDILDMKIESNRKQENRAKEWAFEKLAPLSKIHEAFQKGYKEVPELAEYLDVTEDFMKEALLYYQRKYRDFKERIK